ncbi:hypothetical protein [Fluviicola taffensis]|uniref:Lipoprotein n=1 Tax=Fluviicola taffensis (strain DSM 16823 / NCIMB 13979 / RW262) TaxID=755732 RepID=F2IBP5_FLUTR|nr:hypothetical protein [Fluviicola taffensis]AEA45371.1 hypothetical protein Fluta_3399 [Fluviicola taffensis DSM 16823]
MKIKFGLFLLLSIVFTSCSDEADDTITIEKRHSSKEALTDNTISTNFNENSFKSKVEAELLVELHLCDPKATKNDDPAHPSCSPNFFRFFKLNKNTPLKDGFKLLIKAGVNGFPIRRMLIFEREGGNLVKLNGFNGNLIEERKTSSGYDDLVIRFPDNINNNITYYNCLFRWKDGRYDYVNCEVIDEDVPRKVKAEFIDSMGVEIKKILDRNNMLF